MCLKIGDLNEFKNNPKKLVELLDIENNYSPDIRKILNDKIFLLWNLLIKTNKENLPL